jgi:hypothetical protein
MTKFYGERIKKISLERLIDTLCLSLPLGWSRQALNFTLAMSTPRQGRFMDCSFVGCGAGPALRHASSAFEEAASDTVRSQWRSQ